MSLNSELSFDLQKRDRGRAEPIFGHCQRQVHGPQWSSRLSQSHWTGQSDRTVRSNDENISAKLHHRTVHKTAGHLVRGRGMVHFNATKPVFGKGGLIDAQGSCK